MVAAGNAGSSPGTIRSPGTARKAITVGASDKSDIITSFSSRGPVVWKDSQGDEKYLIKPDVTAPGVNICAAQYDSVWDDRTCFDDNHVVISGTSMATPHLAGAAALLLQKNPDWTPEEIKIALRNTAIDIGEDVNTLEDVYEPYLMRIGYLEKTSRGRQIPEKMVPSLKKRFAS